MYILQLAVSFIMLVLLFVVAFLSINLVIKIPGNKKLGNFETEEQKRKEKELLKKFMKIYIFAITVLILVMLLAIYIFFM